MAVPGVKYSPALHEVTVWAMHAPYPAEAENVPAVPCAALLHTVHVAACTPLVPVAQLEPWPAGHFVWSAHAE